MASRHSIVGRNRGYETRPRRRNRNRSYRYRLNKKLKALGRSGVFGVWRVRPHAERLYDVREDTGADEGTSYNDQTNP